MWDWAPPPDLSGNTGTDAIGVGAHLFHVNPSLLADGYDCSQCHVKPAEIASPGHMDDGLPAEVTFGPLAATDGASPAWDRSTPSCSGTYCHGATLEGGAQVSPLWAQNQFPPEEDLCGTCHPIQDMTQGSHAPHLAHGFDCSFCHEGYTTDAVVTSLHVNGTRDVIPTAEVGGSFDGESCSGVRCHGAGNTTPVWGAPGNLTCTDCHGGGSTPSDTLAYSADVTIAPPPDLSGTSDSTSTGVGAHRSHLVEGEFRINFECSDCHLRPTEVGSEGHIGTDLIAEVTFGDLARTQGATPAWDRQDMACSGTYCHGATHVQGPSPVNAPLWTVVDGSQAFCGSCHRIPPHDNFGPCNICHGNVVSADTTITDFGKTLHVNGTIDF
jgi:predicted CxxxxCH...CXXCH cytochrome family protein